MSISPDSESIIGRTSQDDAHDAAEPFAAPPARGSGSPKAILALAAVLVLGMIGQYLYTKSVNDQLLQLRASLQESISLQDKGLSMLNNKLKEADTRQTGLQDELSLAKNRIGSTQSDLDRTRAVAAEAAKRNQEQLEAASAQLASQLGQLQQEQSATKGNLGSLATDVTGVKGEVKSTQAELNAAKAELKRVIGDLGVQSDLIARNGSELADLRLRGERDYIEFDLTKKAKRQKVGVVHLELKKTDDRRQKYTLALTADDKTVEKKDRTSFEPVQFYLQGQRQATEIVVQKVLRDRITGYISTPKVKDARASL